MKKLLFGSIMKQRMVVLNKLSRQQIVVMTIYHQFACHAKMFLFMYVVNFIMLTQNGFSLTQSTKMFFSSCIDSGIVLGRLHFIDAQPSDLHQPFQPVTSKTRCNSLSFQYFSSMSVFP